MPYTPKQRRFFHAVASGNIPAKKGLSRAKAKKLASEADHKPLKRKKS